MALNKCIARARVNDGGAGKRSFCWSDETEPDTPLALFAALGNRGDAGSKDLIGDDQAQGSAAINRWPDQHTRHAGPGGHQESAFLKGHTDGGHAAEGGCSAGDWERR